MIPGLGHLVCHVKRLCCNRRTMTLDVGSTLFLRVRAKTLRLKLILVYFIQKNESGRDSEQLKRGKSFILACVIFSNLTCILFGNHNISGIIFERTADIQYYSQSPQNIKNIKNKIHNFVNNFECLDNSK